MNRLRSKQIINLKLKNISQIFFQKISINWSKDSKEHVELLWALDTFFVCNHLVITSILEPLKFPKHDFEKIIKFR
jgi:hypothetical protein